MATGLQQKKIVSDDLQVIIGKKKASRSEAVKLIWVYIKEYDLQDENDGRIIYCDDELKTIYGKKKIKLTDVGGKKLSEHLS